MSRTYIRFCSEMVALLLFLVGCNSKTISQPATPVATETKGSTFYHWVYLPMDSLAQDSQETIAKKLFGVYLEQFKQGTVDEQIRLKDYKILEASLPSQFQYCVKDLGIESIVDIQYSVQTVYWHNPDWDAGNGTDGDDHWINDKDDLLAIFKYGNDYSFKTMGDPPCAGIAIDGSKVP
jgi:hypothetical protein